MGIDQFTVRELFDRLDQALANRRLITSKGTRRRVHSNEFQLYIRSNVDTPSGYAFTHRRTHSRVVLDARTGVLTVRDGDVFDEFVYVPFECDGDRQGV